MYNCTKANIRHVPTIVEQLSRPVESNGRNRGGWGGGGGGGEGGAHSSYLIHAFRYAHVPT